MSLISKEKLDAFINKLHTVFQDKSERVGEITSNPQANTYPTTGAVKTYVDNKTSGAASEEELLEKYNALLEQIQAVARALDTANEDLINSVHPMLLDHEARIKALEGGRNND